MTELETTQRGFRQLQKQLAVAFIIFLVVGGALAPVNAWLPAVSVGAYFLLGLFLTRTQKNSDKFADSLYYLGLLLTLWALLLSTLDTSSATDSIISNLGTG